MDKFCKTLVLFEQARRKMSLATRMLVVNIFLFSLFSYQNRLFFMPSGTLRSIESKVLGFLTPIAWAKLGMFSAAGALYGLQVSVKDLRISNVASLLATHDAWPDLQRGTAEVLARWRRRHTFLANPSISWKVGFDFYRHRTGNTHSATLAEARGRHDRPVHPFRVLYNCMARSELQQWTAYLKNRVGVKGWDGDLLVRGLKRLPRSTPQVHRWFLLRMHLNAPVTAVRVALAGVHVDDTTCSFCGAGPDSLGHISRCNTVLTVYDDICVEAALPPLSDARSVLMLQEDWDGASVASAVAFFAAIWDVRAMCRRGVRYANQAALTELVMTSLRCPWLVRCCPTKSKRERRADRVREPNPVPHAVIYRSDGASRGQGRLHDREAGWGSAVWSATLDGRGVGPPAAVCRGYLGDASNNVAEYSGLRECMDRAVRILDRTVVFEVDSMLLAMQMARRRPWACRSESLIGFHEVCIRLGEQLSRNNVDWLVRHVYREFNQTADALSNQAIDEQDSNGASAAW